MKHNYANYKQFRMTHQYNQDWYSYHLAREDGFTRFQIWLYEALIWLQYKTKFGRPSQLLKMVWRAICWICLFLVALEFWSMFRATRIRNNMQALSAAVQICETVPETCGDLVGLVKQMRNF